jgi:hypothetical protein
LLRRLRALTFGAPIEKTAKDHVEKRRAPRLAVNPSDASG